MTNRARQGLSLKMMLLLLAVAGAALAADDVAPLIGTFSNVHTDGRGVTGEELKIVKVEDGYQGSLRIARGDAGSWVKVKISVDGNKIRFTIPHQAPHPGEFHGSVLKEGIEGEFLFLGQDQPTTVSLKRCKVNWDS